MAKNKSVDKKDQLEVEKSLERLDAIVEKLESDETHLNEAIDLFREGNELASLCRKQLEEAELLVKTIADEAEL